MYDLRVEHTNNAKYVEVDETSSGKKLVAHKYLKTVN